MQTKAGLLIARRYRLRRLLGEGGESRVWAADDEITHLPVAVKLLRPLAEIELARLRSETAVMRQLRMPGVVRLLDEGIEHEQPFIVMDLVRGAPFPGEGRARSWPAMVDVTLALVETLARIHAAGVVHRDLKPQNVLVSPDGRPTVLDFGMALGARIGEVFARDGSLHLTPAYCAPEQIGDGPITPRTDLYSLGLMIFEALTGEIPHFSKDVRTLLRARLTAPTPSLRHRAPGVPAAVAGLVDALLARTPGARTPSAAAVISILLGQQRAAQPEGELSRLDGDEPVNHLVKAARAGQSMDIMGPRRSGRTRCLRDVEKALAAEGREVLWAAPARVAFASLEPIIGPLEGTMSCDLRTIEGQVDAALAERLSSGAALLVDDIEDIDRWSASALDRCRSLGVVFRASVIGSPCGDPGREEGVVRLLPLSERSLRSLFAGPDRLFHLREDAARILWQRTGGAQADVAEELMAWQRAGLLRWHEEKVVVDRDALDRLESSYRPIPLQGGVRARAATTPSHPELDDLLSWLSLSWPHANPHLLGSIMSRPVWRVEADIEELTRIGAVRRLADGRLWPMALTSTGEAWSPARRRDAHRALAELLPPGAEGRLFHLLSSMNPNDSAAIDADAIALEADALARRLAGEGHTGRATAALAEGIFALRRAPAESKARSACEERLLTTWVEIALADGTQQVEDQVMYELSRAAPRSHAIVRLDTLMQARLAFKAGGDRALQILDGLGPFEEHALERLRQGLRMLAARRCDQAREDALLEEVRRWAVATPDLVTRARFARWLGWYHYRKGRFREAARLHAEAVEHEPWLISRIAARDACASALMEAFDYTEAIAWAEAAEEQAQACRNVFFEARAERLLRAARYRIGVVTAPDLELVTLAAPLGSRDLHGVICFNEAAVAYRAGLRDVAAALSGEAFDDFTFVGDPAPRLLSRCLALSAGASPASSREIQELSKQARVCPIDGIAIQSLALLAEARGAPPPPSWGKAAEARAAAVPSEHWRFRLDVLSIEESLSKLGVALPRR